MKNQSLLRKPRREEISKGVSLLHDIHEENSPLVYINFRLLELQEGSLFQESLGEKELCLVVLSGKVTVKEGENTFSKIGRRDSVFDEKPTDSVYIGSGRSFSVTGESPLASLALCYSPAHKNLPTQLIPASDNSTEERGKYQNKRRIHNILPDSLEIAEKLLVVEVYTKGGNVSSYPPHKHDEDNLPYESLLEETYYHEINPSQGFVFQRVYTQDKTLNETMSVEHKDVVVVPKGYHPVAVPDGYDSYYLNVMAGPKRVWKFHNDPDHAWILERP